MASNKTTIYKFDLSISDLDQDRYESLPLTIAQHPSETIERMMVRLLAFAMNVHNDLQFSAGLSTPDEPDIWQHSLDGQLLLWVDVGEPSVDRIKKASRTASTTRVYSFNSKSDVWWNIEKSKFADLAVEVFQFPWTSVQALAGLAQRTMDISLTISDTTIYIAGPKGEAEVECRRLQ